MNFLSNRSLRKNLFMWIQILAGTVICALAYNMFLIPNDIAPGGFTGIGQLISHITNWPIGTVTLLLNIPLFLLSARQLGLSFGVRSLVATIGLSLMIDFLPIPSIIPADTSERMLLASVFGGVIAGAGFGLIIRGGATTGGTDMLARLINERFHAVSIGMIMFTVDAVVIVASAFIFDIVSALFALISTFLMSHVIDLLLDGVNSARAYFIISESSEAIAARVMNELERGATSLNGRGLYSGTNRDVLLCVVSRTESVHLRAIVAEIDPHAFMIATNVHEALGEGFRPHAKPFPKA